MKEPQPQPHHEREKVFQEDHIFGNGIRLTKKQRKKAVLYLVTRDGANCSFCRTILVDPLKADVDHIDPWADSRHKASNLRLACHSCNSHQFTQVLHEKIKTATASASASSHREREKKKSQSLGGATEQLQEDVDYQKGSIEMQVTGYAELPFINWVAGHLRRDGWMNWNNAIFGGAAQVGVSSSTTDRYMKKHAYPFNLTGPFKRTKNVENKRFEIRPNTDHAYWKGEPDEKESRA